MVEKEKDLIGFAHKVISFRMNVIKACKAKGIDAPTDVLSFPNVSYEKAGDFSVLLGEQLVDLLDPDTGRIMFGDIVINEDRVRSQAKDYGHSVKREFAFLVAHSMLHLCGYDHMEEEEAKVMEKKQEDVLGELGITRD